MKKILLTSFFALAVCAVLSAYPGWQAIKSDNFTVFYQSGYDQHALRLLSDIEYYKMIPEGVVGNTGHNLPFVLEDFGQYVNGFTDPVYYRINIINTPTDDVDWFSLVVVHEYTHLVQMTKSSGLPAVLQFIFGNAACPQLEAPMWSFEAITVYDESKLSKYMGRLNDGGYDQYMSMRSAEDTFPSLLEATYVPFAMPAGESPYLYGSKFLNFLAQTYGEDKLKKYYEAYGSSVMSYLSPAFPWLGMDRTMDEIFGGTTETLWEKWRLSEKEKAANYKQEGDNITRTGWFSGTPMIYNGALYYTRSLFEKTGIYDYKANYDLMAMDLKTDEKKVIATSMTGYTTPPRFYKGRIYYTVSEMKPGYANESNLSYGTFTVMYEKDLATGAEREVFSDAIRGFAIDDNGVIFYSVDNPASGGSQILQYDTGASEKKFLMDSDYLVMDMAYGAGQLAVSAVKEGSNADLYLLDIKERKFTLVAGTPYYETQPEIYGNKLFFRANYGKIYSAYCYDLKDGKISRLTENGVASSPAYDEASGDIYFIGLNTKGFDVYKKKAEFKGYKLPDDKNDYVPAPMLDASKVIRGGYLDDLATLYPKVRVPFIYTTDGSNLAGGLVLSGSDAMGDFTYTATGNYDFGLQKAGYFVDVYTSMLAPLTLSLAATNQNYDMGEISADINIPLYRSQRPGLSSAYINLNYKAFDGFDRRQIVPGAGLDFAWPSTRFSVYASRMFEGKWLGSTLAARQGVYTGMSLTQYMPDTKILLRGSAIYDPDNTDNVISGVRGYSYDPRGNYGSRWLLDITRPLFQIRKGLWNPLNIYLEDVCGGLFADAAFARDTQYSFGAELKLETRFFMLLATEVGVRASYNKDGKFDTTFLLMVPGAIF